MAHCGDRGYNMPIYEYRCEDCENIFEDYRSVDKRNEPEKEPCPFCKGKVHIKVSLGNFLNKASKNAGGWSKDSLGRHYRVFDERKSKSDSDKEALNIRHMI